MKRYAEPPCVQWWRGFITFSTLGVKHLTFRTTFVPSQYFKQFFIEILLGHENVAKLLIENGTDISAKDNGGDTSLHTSAYYGKWMAKMSL